MILSNDNNRKKNELVRNKNYVTWRDCFRAENSVTSDDTPSLVFCSIQLLLARWPFGAILPCSIDAVSWSSLCALIPFFTFILRDFEWLRKVAIEIIQHEPVFQHSENLTPHTPRTRGTRVGLFCNITECAPVRFTNFSRFQSVTARHRVHFLLPFWFLAEHSEARTK